MPVIPATRRQRQEDSCKSEANQEEPTKGVAAHAFDPNTQEAEAGGLCGF